MKQPKLNNMRVDAKGTAKLRAQMAKAKKIKITINVDEEILETVRKMSDESGIPYQTLMNKILREAIGTKVRQESRLDHLEKELAAIKKKISA